MRREFLHKVDPPDGPGSHSTKLRLLTASPAPSTSLPSPSLLALIGRRIGLASPIWALRIGLLIALAEPKLSGLPFPLEGGTIGDDAPEFRPLGMEMGRGMGWREELGVRGLKRLGWDSRRNVREGETARRLLAVGYGS